MASLVQQTQNQKPQQPMEIMMKYYSNKSNAARAAKAAGLDIAKCNLFINERIENNKTIKEYCYGKKIAKPAAPKSVPVAPAKAKKNAVAKDAPAPEVKVRPTQIGGIDVVRESSVERPCKRVWHIADDMKGAKRKEVLEACVAAGIAYYTARTQYQQWLACQKEMAARTPANVKK